MQQLDELEYRIKQLKEPNQKILHEINALRWKINNHPLNTHYGNKENRNATSQTQSHQQGQIGIDLPET